MSDLVVAGLVAVFAALVALVIEVKRLHDGLRPLLDSSLVTALSSV